MNYLEVQEALLYFESIFEIPFDEAIITRVDIANTMAVDNPVEMYTDLLMTPIGYEYTIRRRSRLFESYTKDLYFYDKVDQLKNCRIRCHRPSNKLLSQKYANQNLLKYESRYHPYAKLSLNLTDLKFKNFYVLDNYQKLIENWYQGYKEVPKLAQTSPIKLLNFESLETLKDSHVGNDVASLGGYDVLLSYLKGAKMDKSVRCRAKKYYNKLSKEDLLYSDLVLELDKKVEEVYNNEIAFFYNLRSIAPKARRI